MQKTIKENYGDWFFNQFFMNFIKINDLESKYFEWSNIFAESLSLVDFFFNSQYKALKKYMQMTTQVNQNDNKNEIVA